MIKAYINYPNPHITAHSDPGCGSIQAQNKPKQRYVRISFATVSEELIKFRDKHYLFAANPERNDMWVEISFQNKAFEMAVLEYIAGLLGQHYGPFRNIEPDIHC